jgi:hypothetical protein
MKIFQIQELFKDGTNGNVGYEICFPLL